jgi:DNA polymerase I
MIQKKYQHMYPALYTKVTSVAAFDVETTGLRAYHGDRIFAYCIGHHDGRVDVYRLDNADERKNRRSMTVLRRFFADTSIAKIAHNYKFELAMLRALGIDVPDDTVWHDTMIISQLLRNLAPSHALDRVAFELFGYPRDNDRAVDAAKKSGRMMNVDVDLMTRYQIDDGVRTMLLYRLWCEDSKDMHPDTNPELWHDYLNEIALIRATQRMEEYGLMVDDEGIDGLLVWLEDQYQQVQSDTFAYLGELINLKSDTKVRALLYQRMKFPVLRLSKRGKMPSVDKDTIFELKESYPDEQIFDLILRWRSYQTGLTYVNGYRKLADRNRIMHPGINTNQARTGRQSSSNPNLQNVSKEEAVKNPFAVPARRAFRARPKHAMYFADYSGIEMRLIADQTGEPEFMELIEQGGDPHGLALEVLCHWLDAKALKRDDPHGYRILRGAVKNAQFAIAYGAGLLRVANTLKVSPEKMEAGYYGYCDRFPLVSGFTHAMIRQVESNGYVTTPFGRRLWIRLDKPYSASNYLIQGTGAQILKRGEIRVDDYFKNEWSYDVRCVLPIHDELVFEMPVDLLKYQDQILYNVSHLMTDMPEIEISLEVEVKKTKVDWASARDYLFRKAA